MQGLINVLKPTGLTSSDVVVRVRGLLRAKYGLKLRVGHLGTLDPGASGVLPIAVGSATKLFDLLQEKTKIYRASITFGQSTDTIDSYGKILRTTDIVPCENDVKNILGDFIGKIVQVPPKYSAICINGKRAYQLAREGKDFELKSREVTVYAMNLVEKIDIATYIIDVECSSGTYIRTLVSDIAEKLNSLAYMSYLIRLKSGDLEIEDSQTLDELNEHINIIPINEALKEYPRIDILNKHHDKLMNGVRISLNDLPEGQFLVYINNELFGIGHDEENKLVIDVRFML